MVKKIGLLILIVLLSILLASIYGFLHNQVSYSISNEYFTIFKFDQFGSIKYTLDFPRMSAGLIGIASTWWFGLLIGLVYGIIGMFQSTPSIMWKSSFDAIIRTLIITIVFGIIGILIGTILISNLNVDWNLPTDLIFTKRFLIAGTMHNFSYLGGMIGLIYGIFFQLKIKKSNIKRFKLWTTN